MFVCVSRGSGGGVLFLGINWFGFLVMNLSLNSCFCFVREDTENLEVDVFFCFNGIWVFLRVCIGAGTGDVGVGRVGKVRDFFYGRLFIFCS